ncbi:nucleotidyltransferase family protein [Alkalicoccus urumqiensis]|uniref:MobA-like NTP transferase domain-containing protein n=1 Tax=Alkalicoccus urumqiensis TaxID=1548213 RepID=A0A2P6MLL9_ALKUR|nr:nucleotidyltransferase family protein [Alkalicoccus urumqiensis]PRO67177.1 hypothetical protein C6I21_01050 [Alkalicoccus urumqiensis]
MTHALVLAAGRSSRMGRLKQVMEIDGVPMVERAVRAAGTSDVLVVTGYRAEEVMKAVTSPAACHYHAGWREGQGSSLAAGIRALPKETKSILVFLADQPFLPEALVRLIRSEGEKRLRETEEPFMVRPRFRGIPGHPVFIGHVDQLPPPKPGDRSGKTWLPDERICFVETNEAGAAADLDTPEDAAQALSKLHHV